MQLPQPSFGCWLRQASQVDFGSPVLGKGELELEDTPALNIEKLFGN